MYRFIPPVVILAPHDSNVVVYAQVCWLFCVFYMPLFVLVQATRVALPAICFACYMEFLRSTRRSRQRELLRANPLHPANFQHIERRLVVLHPFSPVSQRTAICAMKFCRRHVEKALCSTNVFFVRGRQIICRPQTKKTLVLQSAFSTRRRQNFIAQIAVLLHF